VFGSHVALALELARAHRMREQLAVFTDRDRIARDLHDLVIQRLFAVGLSIQSLRRVITSDSGASTLQNVTAELDETIRELRNTIYSLSDSAGEKELLSSRVLHAVRNAARSLRFVPRLALTGPVDAIRDEETASSILAVVTEGLSNAVRHSGADAIRVAVTVDEGFVCVLVQDTGLGFTMPSPGNGLTNLQHRADMLGGTFDVSSSPETGTALTWRAPVF
jgi:two-component system, NarL family, sensor histidine kinase DevS